MPPALDQIDLETLVREAVSSLAVSAYARGIGISAHIDNRLPSRVLGDAAALNGFLRRGLTRTIEAGQTGKIALALWLDDTVTGDGEAEAGKAGVLLEVCRALPDGERRMTGLAGLWTLPIGGGNAQPAATRQSDGAETVMIPLPCEPVPGSPLMACKWGCAFDGRFILHVRGLLFDRERCRASLAASGLEAAFTTDPEAALELARSRAENGQTVDFLLLDGHRLGAAAVTLAKEFREDPRLAGARIMLTGDSRGLELSPGDAALFDAAAWVSMPWRRLMDVLHDLVRTSDAAPARQAAGGVAASDIPTLTGRRILIAEDVATNQVLLGAVLEPTGAEIEIVADGAAVLERHTQLPADLILMDLQMPGMGGIAATRRLRALGGLLSTVRVIALTAYARSADRQMALDAGMDAYLAKPIVVAEFYDLLRRLLPEDGDGDGDVDGDAYTRFP
jgi:CheY-like chemotaxis protein